MKRKYKPVLRVLALIMVIVCLGVSLAPASFAFAGVLDPGAWLYPIWSIYGAANGVNVTSKGGADFTISGMTSLWDEYQSYRVSQGLQNAVQSISEFVAGATDLVSVVANTVAGSTLGTKLQIGSTVVRVLTSFWNWIIKEKLGGTSVDSTDFALTSGNLVLSGYDNLVVLPKQSTGSTSGAYIGKYRDHDVYVSTSSNDEVIVLLYGTNTYIVTAVCSVSGASFDEYEVGSGNSNRGLTYYNTTYGLYYMTGGTPITVGTQVIESSGSVEQMLQVAYQYFNGQLPTAGDLTVAPDAGVDVLGFPDASDQDYVPADAVIPWNIPYDQTKDTLDYIEAAFADAVTNDLEIGEAGEIVQPVPGVGPVGDYVAVGLGDVFPFCIPFDIYDFLSALAADPVAPSFTAELAFPEAVGGTQYVELDFDTPTFNQLASILRTMELLAFIVGLALLTRSMFIRG